MLAKSGNRTGPQFRRLMPMRDPTARLSAAKQGKVFGAENFEPSQFLLHICCISVLGRRRGKNFCSGVQNPSEIPRLHFAEGKICTNWQKILPSPMDTQTWHPQRCLRGMKKWFLSPMNLLRKLVDPRDYFWAKTCHSYSE